MTRLKLPPTRFPSDSTFRRVMMGIDFTDLAAASLKKIGISPKLLSNPQVFWQEVTR